MGDVLKLLMDKLPSWFYIIAAVIILIALAWFFYITLVSAKKIKDMISTLLKHDDHTKELQGSVDKLRDELKDKNKSAEQMSTALFNIKPLIETLNNIRSLDNPEQRMSEAQNLIQRALDSLAADIKTESGGKHRCGLWITNNQSLRLVFASAYFPKNYKGSRELHLDRSLAGKCFRRQQTIKWDDVTTDSDWTPNPDTRSVYKSLICIPSGNWGVLTVDGINKMSEESLYIAETYGSVIDGAIIENLKASNERDFMQTIEFEENVG